MGTSVIMSQSHTVCVGGNACLFLSGLPPPPSVSDLQDLLKSVAVALGTTIIDVLL